MSLRSLTLMGLLVALAAACAPPIPVTPPHTEPITATPEPVGPAHTEPAALPEAASPEPALGVSTYTFVAGETIARFVVEEVLSGNPKTVVGETDAVTGTISLDWGAPTQAALGPIEVDLSGLDTDSGFRNRAIREAILQSDKEENRVATFTATEISGLPESVTPGTSYELTITGDLTIKGRTRQVTFEAVVTPVSVDRIEGAASLSVPYADFGVDIPFLPPQVASVEDIVRLEIDLVATR
jgi:polyisoprenoid-binding protein YceI